MKNIVGVNKRSTLNKSQGTDGALNFDTNALKEYVNDFSASRHFFVSYKNILEYHENSIEKAYILSYINPSPENVNQWSRFGGDDYMDQLFELLYEGFVYGVTLMLRLPHIVHYLLVYIVLVALLTTALQKSKEFSSDAPYLILISIFVVILILLVWTYISSLDFHSIRPSIADTEDKGDSEFNDRISDGEQEEIKLAMQLRVEETKNMRTKTCICCKENDIHVLDHFNQVKGTKNYEQNLKICPRCVSLVCQCCCKAETQKILRFDRGDGCTICANCVDNVCRKCKTYHPSSDVTLRQSQHGRTLCKRCKLIGDLHKGSPTRKAPDRNGQHRSPRVLPNPNISPRGIMG